jgi:hypothetical protein
MDSISNSGVSLILNPDIANAINDNENPHDLSTCEEEFENQEEIHQMLVNAFDSQSLSNTDNDEHGFDDDEEEEQVPVEKYFDFIFLNSIYSFLFVLYSSTREDYILLQQENENLRHRLAEYAANEEIYRQNALEHKHETHEIEQLTHKTSEQQLEILTLRQMYETVFDEKCHVDEQINDIRLNEQNLQEKFDKIQIEYDQLVKSNKKPLMINILTQTVRQEFHFDVSYINYSEK